MAMDVSSVNHNNNNDKILLDFKNNSIRFQRYKVPLEIEIILVFHANGFEIVKLASRG
jgi:hypothetical protein